MPNSLPMVKKKKPKAFMLSSSKFVRLALGSKLVLSKTSPNISLESSDLSQGVDISSQTSSVPSSSGFFAVAGSSSGNVEIKSVEGPTSSPSLVHADETTRKTPLPCSAVQVESNLPSAGSPVASVRVASPKNLASRIKESAQLEELGTSTQHVSGAPFVLIPDDNLEDAKEEFKDFLFARFQGDAPPVGRIIGVINAVWARNGPRIFVHKIGDGSFLLK
ncbi:hypothetical protein HID58_047624, partial [Brassica napus]